MGMTNFDRWLTTDSAAEAAEAEYDAFVRWCEAEGRDECDDDARAEFDELREAKDEANAEAQYEARMEAKADAMYERGEW